MSTKNKEEIDLLAIIRALWSKAILIILFSALCGVIGFAGSKIFISPKYQASILVYVNNSNGSSNSSYISTTELSAAKSLVDTYSVILKSRSTLETVINESGISRSYEALSGMISSSAVNNTEVFRVSVKSTSPDEAQLIANTIADILPSKISAVVSNSSVSIVDYASRPTSRYSPNYTRNALFAAIAGFILASALVILVFFLDDSIHDEDYLVSTYGIPVLASIPNLNDTKSNGYGYYYGSKAKN